MRKQDHLLGLIASLNLNERQHFRIFASQQQNSSYLKLFDALEGKAQYNAAELRRTLALSAAQLDKQKAYLAKVLLKSLRIYKDGVSFLAEMSNTLLEIEELMGRRLYDYALELADKALAHAERKDYHYLVPSILYFKLDILILTGRYDLLKEVEGRMKVAEEANMQQQNIHVMMARVQEFEQSQKKPHYFRYHNHPLLKMKPKDITSKRALVGWFNIMHYYQMATERSSEEIVLLARKCVTMQEEDTSLRKISGPQYLYSYQALAVAEGEAGNYEKGWQATEKLLQLIPTYTKILKPASISTMLENADVIRVRLSFFMGEYHKTLAIAKKVEEENDLQTENTLFALAFDKAKALLHTGKTTGAVTVLDELLQMNPDLRTNLRPYLRPLMILAQLQMGNYQLVLYLIKSSRAWMKRHHVSDAEIELFLSHAYAIAKAPIAQRKELWQKLKTNAAKNSMHKLNTEIHLSRWLKEFAP